MLVGYVFCFEIQGEARGTNFCLSPKVADSITEIAIKEQVSASYLVCQAIRSGLNVMIIGVNPEKKSAAAIISAGLQIGPMFAMELPEDIVGLLRTALVPRRWERGLFRVVMDTIETAIRIYLAIQEEVDKASQAVKLNQDGKPRMRRRKPREEKKKEIGGEENG